VIEQYLKNGSYSVPELQMMAKAFDGVCKSLGVKIRDDKIGQAVAKAIISASRIGVADVFELESRALGLLKRA
jgi:hypothetical protein